MLRKFKSIAHEKQYGYAYDSMAYDAHAPIEAHFRMYDTYGDGLCQHSPDYSVQLPHLADYLVSLAEAMLTDDELAQNLLFTFSRRPSVKQIEFAASIKYKAPEEKDWNKSRRWFSVQEMKLSKAPAKQYDKRYEELREVHDGSPNAIYRMVLPEYASGLERYLYADAIRDWVLAQDGSGMYMPMTAEFLKWSDDRDKARQLRDAFEACKNVTESHRLRCATVSAIENYKRQIQPKEAPEPETEPEPAAEPAAGDEPRVRPPEPGTAEYVARRAEILRQQLGGGVEADLN